LLRVYWGLPNLQVINRDAHAAKCAIEARTDDPRLCANTDSGNPAMTDGDSVSKFAPPMPGYLSEMMSVSRMVEVLEALHFNKREEARLVLDPGVQAFLIRATKAAAADPNQKVRHAWRAIKRR
jgi:hypothetical protein